MTSATERLDRHFIRGLPEDCWFWTGAKDRDGFGKIWDGLNSVGAHVVAYVKAHGPVPHNKRVRHICRNLSCVNPNHLQAK